jgi:CMP/dCMP kinase
LRASGNFPSYDTVLGEIIERDRKDSSRAMDPLKQADDAVSIETDNRTAEEIADDIVQIVKKRT